MAQIITYIHLSANIVVRKFGTAREKSFVTAEKAMLEQFFLHITAF